MNVKMIIRPDLVEDSDWGMPIMWCDTGEQTYIYHGEDLKVYELSWDEDRDIMIGGKLMTGGEVEDMGGYTIKVEITQPSQGYEKRSALANSVDWDWEGEK